MLKRKKKLYLFFPRMAKKSALVSRSAEALGLRRSGRETPSKKQATASPSNTRNSERSEKQTSPNPSPAKKKPENIEKPTEPSPLRRSDRGKKLAEVSGLLDIKSKKKKSANSAGDVNEVKENGRQNSNVSDGKRKKFTIHHYKSLFKPQRIQLEIAYLDVDKELKSLELVDQTVAADSVCQQMNGFTEGHKVSLNSRRVQGIPDKDQKKFLAGNSIFLQQVGCPSQTKPNDGKCSESGNVEMETKSNDAKFTESGNVEKHIGDNCSPSSVVNHDLENHQECDSRDKVTRTCKADAVVVNAENDDAATNSGNIYISSKFVEFWVPVQISNVQLEQYCAALLSNAVTLQSCSKTDSLGALSDVYVSNQKCCNHPYLVDPHLEKLITKDLKPSMMLDASIKASDKLHFLDLILPEVRKRQQRVLVFFQPTFGLLRKASMGNILEDYVHRRFGQESYEIVDGSTSSKKQAASNKFNKEMSRFIFLLESRACSQSIKLLSVDIIIIFDSDLIPATDLRALQKVNIDSQSEPIMIFRLYTSSTLEEKILKLAEQNVAIDIRSQTLRSNYHALLTWGASELFNKLTEFHTASAWNISSDGSLTKDVVEEFLYIISHKSKSRDSVKSLITRVQNFGIYGQNIPLHSEIKTHLPHGDHPHVFWRNLLEGRNPLWKFVPESTPRQRKRPNYFLDSDEESGMDGGGVKRRRKTVISTIEPGQWKPVIEGESSGINEGGFGPPIHNKSQSFSGDPMAVTNEMSLHDLLKPTVSELCSALKFSEDVSIIVERFLKFVLENFCVSKEHTSTLQAFMISLCWIGASLVRYNIDRSESFALATKLLNFSCLYKEADSVYKKLERERAKELFLQHTEVLDALEECIHTPQEVKLDTENCQHTQNCLDGDETAPNDVVPDVDSEEMEMPGGNCDKENAEDRIISPDTLHAAECNNEVGHNDVGSHAFEDHHDLCGSNNNNNSLSADVSLDKTPLVQPSATPPSDDTMQTILEIENVAHQVQQDNDRQVDLSSLAETTTAHHESSNEKEVDKYKRQMEDLSRKVQNEINEFNKDWDEKRVNIENDYNVDGALIRILHTKSASVRSEKLNILEKKYADKLNEYKRLREIHLEDIKAKLLAVNDELPLQVSQHEVAPIEAQSHDEPDHDTYVSIRNVTDGGDADKIESTRSHTPDKQMADATESSEPVGEIPTQQNDDMEINMAVADATVLSESIAEVPAQQHDDMTGDVAVETDLTEMELPLVDSNQEHASLGGNCRDRSHASEDGDETAPNDVVPDVDYQEMRMPCGNCEKENAEDRTIIPHTLHAAKGNNEVSHNDVGSHVDSAEASKPTDKIESTRSHTPDKQMADATVSIEPVGEIPAQQNDDMAVADAIVLSEAVAEVPAQQNDDMTGNVVGETDLAEMELPVVDSSQGHASLVGNCLGRSHASEDGDETAPTDVVPDVVSQEMGMPGGNCDKENAEDRTISLDTLHAAEGNNDVGHNDVASTLADNYNEENIGDNDTSSHAFEDHDDLCGSNNNNNSLSADVSLDKTPLVQPSAIPPSDHTMQAILETDNVSHQVQQPLDTGFQDKDGQVDQITLEDSPLDPHNELILPSSTDPLVPENQSNILALSRLLVEHSTEPTLIVSQSGESLEEHRVAAETPLGEYKSSLPSSDAPPLPLPINPLDMFHNLNQLGARMPNHGDPLQAEAEQLRTENHNVTKLHEDNKQRLKSDCEKEITEAVAQIRLKYEVELQKADAAFHTKKKELDTNLYRVIMNRILAEAFRAQCQDLSPPVRSGMQQVSQPGLMQQLHRISGPSSTRRPIGTASASPGQASGSQQTTPPPSFPPPRMQFVLSSEIRSRVPHMRSMVSSESRAPAPHMRSMASSGIRAPSPHMRSVVSSEIFAPAPHIQPIRSTSDFATQQGMPRGPHIQPIRSQSPLPTSSQQLLPLLSPEASFVPQLSPPSSLPSTPSPLPHSSSHIPLQRVQSSGGPSLASTGGCAAAISPDSAFQMMGSSPPSSTTNWNNNQALLVNGINEDSYNQTLPEILTNLSDGNQNSSNFVMDQQQTLNFRTHTDDWTGNLSQNGDVTNLGSLLKKSVGEPTFKRPRLETPSPLPTFKVREEKLGDRVTALHQLVSPFGKTDTSSVLHKAIEHIKLLHDQVNVLSNPYMKNVATTQRQIQDKIKNVTEGAKQKHLRSRGLCLVPVSSTFPIASGTAPEYWTSGFGSTFK